MEQINLFFMWIQQMCDTAKLINHFKQDTHGCVTVN